ncbi:hypothetical protein QLH32_17775 [Acinetobacter corruptisaponis]|uniref:Uncharacterized protein n=1 Tax=Acinetobacter corruptisaponis TaxID=3045147 RepID=A0ABY8S5P5_9GAMM|nr:hypothetical protein [Acinetobacter sp. KCTC 92772]WHP05827.1 hypothetical protein QLH32_17775 [Acinetobacter sp. KCTC 92772]
MIGRQRNILATLGIDVWIPREVVCEKNTVPSLWRDQEAEQIQSLPIQFETPSQNKPELQIKHEPVQPITMVEPLDQTEIIVKPNVVEMMPDKEQVIVKTQVQSFELQMYILESCAILVESSRFNEAQQQLWQNIQKAKLGQYAELKWPFPLADFQESRGLPSYIQGFLDATAMNKKILCLGHLDFIQHSNILHLASLEEMIAQPLLKRRLWQLMQ